MLRFDNSPKRPTNLSLNAKVLDMARELGMNVSQTVDALLAEEVRRRYWERWNKRTRTRLPPTTPASSVTACRWPSTAPS